ncbi:ATP-binding protein [Cytobacillus spongiae]|jgi:two-component system sporulation sensor kinase B|uniref:ATP-binding protein n=1 Tax=Cytobacillus spongiae TaxID=2901381 RepID=UPI001F21F7EE|nr:ATP-binding protein [Cytobacillus spongiae]UII57080.1 ATP-binding protein [Cytobacillus spongiae]
MAIAGPLLINTLIILTGYFFLHVYLTSYKKRVRNANRVIFVVAGIITILVVSFPYVLEPGNIYDLRKIPIILASFYGSIPVGISIIIIMFVYRYVLGGIGVILTLIIYSILLVLLIVFEKKFKRATIKGKIIISSLLAGGTSFLGPFIDLFSGIPILENDYLNFYLLFFLGNSVFMGICVYMTEGIINNYRLRERMVRNEKLGVVSQLAASLAHEIRSPLTASRGFAQLLEEMVTDETQLNYIRITKNEMDRALSTIEDYLTFAKPEAHRLSEVNLREVLLQVNEILTPYKVQNNVCLHLNLHNCYIQADSSKLLQCFVNIVKNAIESMPSGGSVRIYLRRNRETIFVSIKDHGKGMSVEELDRLGTPFYSTKEKGTGLGMMVSMRLIQLMKGTIEFQSEVNKGTEVIVTFQNEM